MEKTEKQKISSEQIRIIYDLEYLDDYYYDEEVEGKQSSYLLILLNYYNSIHSEAESEGRELEYGLGRNYQEISKDVILDLRLTFNDLSVYLALMMLCWKERTKIPSALIEKITGIRVENQSVSISRLEDLHYVEVWRGRYESEFYVRKKRGKSYFNLTNDMIRGIIKNHDKHDIRVLRGIFLANGNGSIPNYKSCKDNCSGRILTRKEHQKINSSYSLAKSKNEHQGDSPEFEILINYVENHTGWDYNDFIYNNK